MKHCGAATVCTLLSPARLTSGCSLSAAVGRFDPSLAAAPCSNLVSLRCAALPECTATASTGSIYLATVAHVANVAKMASSKRQRSVLVGVVLRRCTGGGVIFRAFAWLCYCRHHFFVFLYCVQSCFPLWCHQSFVPWPRRRCRPPMCPVIYLLSIYGIYLSMLPWPGFAYCLCTVRHG